MNSSPYFKYDGSLPGLFTLIFQKFPDLEKIDIIPDSDQLNMLGGENFILTNESQADRVLKSLQEKFGKDFVRRLMYVYSSPFPSKEDIIARTIKGMYIYGKKYLFSSEKIPSEFRRLGKRVGAENHTYKGLLRFKELKDGMFFAEFKPENDILVFLAPHFIRRMPAERFAICDSKRKKCLIYENGLTEIVGVDKLELLESQEEEFIKAAWVKFYQAVAIEERKNESLMVNNMPKKYWKFLPERENF